MTKSRRHIKKLVKNHLKAGLGKQEIFETVLHDLGEELSRDLGQLKRIAHIIRNIPLIETRRKLRTYKILIILFILIAATLQFYIEVPYIQLLGILQLPIWIIIPSTLMIFAFPLLNLVLIPPAIRYKIEAYSILCLINIFVVAKDIWTVKYDLEVFGWLIYILYFSKLVIIVLSAVIWLRLPDRFDIEAIVKTEEKERRLWKIKFK